MGDLTSSPSEVALSQRGLAPGFSGQIEEAQVSSVGEQVLDRRLRRFRHRWRLLDTMRPSLGGAAVHFDDVGKLNEWLSHELHAGDVVLVKGSRGMRLERVVEALTGQQASGGH